MSSHTNLRGIARSPFAAVVATPLLALCVACGGGDDSGSRASDQVASVTDEPTAGKGSKGNEGDASAGEGQGSGQPPAAGKSAFYDAQLAYVRCMRTKAGVKDFPDPKLSGYLDWPKIDKVVDPNGNGEEYKGGKNGVCVPEFRKAEELTPKRDAQQDYESMLAHAKCMRDNGVSKFTNPTMSGGNVIPGGDPNPASPAIDPNAPAYQQAREACKDKLLEGLDGMQ